MNQTPGELGEKPVRKIGKSHRAVTGTLASVKNPAGLPYDSALERDYYLQLEFDPLVARILPQPLLMHYRNHKGRRTRYTPDTLVHSTGSRPPALIEVKYALELQDQKRAAEFRTRFQAARSFAREQGWTFWVVTERTIRAPSLENAQFFQPYLRRICPPQMLEELLSEMARMGTATPGSLFAQFPVSRRTELIPSLNHLIATRQIEADLSLPCTLKSPIWARKTP